MMEKEEKPDRCERPIVKIKREDKEILDRLINRWQG